MAQSRSSGRQVLSDGCVSRGCFSSRAGGLAGNGISPARRPVHSRKRRALRCYRRARRNRAVFEEVVRFPRAAGRAIRRSLSSLRKIRANGGGTLASGVEGKIAWPAVLLVLQSARPVRIADITSSLRFGESPEFGGAKLCSE